MWVLTHVTGMEHRLFHSVTHGVPLENLLDRAVLLGLNLDGWGCRGGVGGLGGSGRVVLIDNGRVNQSKAADARVQVKTTKFGTNVGLNMLLNISSRYFGSLFWSRQLLGLPYSDGYFLTTLWQPWPSLPAFHHSMVKMMRIMDRFWTTAAPVPLLVSPPATFLPPKPVTALT